jgi:hypothetical protein
MSTQETRERLELLQGTLDLLILPTLIFGSQHGHGIARAIQQTSEEELLVDTVRCIPRSSGWRNAAGSLPTGEPLQISEKPAVAR